MLILGAGWYWLDSRVPGAYAPTAAGQPDHGSGLHGPNQNAGHGQPAPEDAQPGSADAETLEAVSVSELTGPETSGPADVTAELVARTGTVELRAGHPFTGYTLNGSTPGPTIRARAGELVEVTLRNENVADGVTLHWHGVDVPNAMDGVAGVTQDAVPPGESYTYRFRADQVGTFWYYSHQVSHRQVRAGLFGALVLEPDPAEAATTSPAEQGDAVALLHTYPDGTRTVNGRSGQVHHRADPGDVLRVRLINTDDSPTSVWVAGSDFRVVGIDGTEVNAPPPVRDQRVQVTAGGRADLQVQVPSSGGVRIHAPGVSMVAGPEGASAPEQPGTPAQVLDPLTYGTAAPLDFEASEPDRSFEYNIGRRPGFLRGTPGYWWTVNGRMGHDVPMFIVAEGDVVRFEITNRSGHVHPMHLHGHHVVVLSRDGVPASGSPWWVDSLNVAHGETYEVAFVADNPGIWMDHCHNLPHAVQGLIAHVAYAGVSSPFRLGADTGNEPE